jgi:hypothetical protein
MKQLLKQLLAAVPPGWRAGPRLHHAGYPPIRAVLLNKELMLLEFVLILTLGASKTGTIPTSQSRRSAGELHPSIGRNTLGKPA